MDFGLMKRVALYSVASGLRAPEDPVVRYQELVLLKRLLELLQINCVLDVGANRGQFASELRKIGYAGHIVSFEPLATEFAALRTSFASDPRWRGFQVAVGAAAGTAEINVVPHLTVVSSLLKPRHRWPNMKTEQVEVRRLQDLLPEALDGIREPRVFLKMDTQGYDLEVFNSLGSDLELICGLQSELAISALYEGMPGYLECLRTYTDAGFELFNLTPVSRVANGALQEMNCFMLRRQP
jgi:FkbM family methyltransferase